MTPLLQRDTNTITIASFWENLLLGKYDFNPPYQRNSIWSDEKQSFLIDSILRNYPIPPIFLHQIIDNATGKTTYQVIDGKQRLTSIERFIKGDIPCSSEFEIADGGEFAGKYFKDFDAKELLPMKHQFWRYPIPVEYIDSVDRDLIDNIFDRLNRNGEPLTGQELRNAKYHGSAFLELVKNKASSPFWKSRLADVDLARMEQYEFISEAMFVILEGGPLHANQKVIDEMYKKYCEGAFDAEKLSQVFDQTTMFLDSLQIDYDGFRLAGVSHLYGLWCFSCLCVSANQPVDTLPKSLEAFYKHLRERNFAIPEVRDYSTSMSSRTKDKWQRMKRVVALARFCGLSKIADKLESAG